MAKILTTTEIKDYCQKLLTIPSFYKNLEQYERDEVHNYALNLKYERETYWSGAVDSPVNIEGALREGFDLDVLKYLLSHDGTYNYAMNILDMIESVNQKQNNIDVPANKPKSNLDWVIYFGLLYKQGKLKISDLTSGTLEAIIEGMAEKTEIEVPKKNRLARHIRGHSEYKQHGIFECPDDKWIFRDAYFNKICKEDSEAYERALSFFNEIKYS